MSSAGMWVSVIHCSPVQIYSRPFPLSEISFIELLSVEESLSTGLPLLYLAYLRLDNYCHYPHGLARFPRPPRWKELQFHHLNYEK